MSKMTRKWLTIGTLLGLAGAGTAVYAQSPGNLLDSLQKGLWELRAIGGGPSRAAQSRICIGDAAKLVQIQHGSAKCKQRILSQKADRVTLSYSCPGLGQGVTTIRKESNRLIHIESQGIRNGSPFNFVVEGRRSASC
ncbi:MAG: hypothetical protein V3V15_06165 [Sphingorhabdus sp.]